MYTGTHHPFTVLHPAGQHYSAGGAADHADIPGGDGFVLCIDHPDALFAIDLLQRSNGQFDARLDRRAQGDADRRAQAKAFWRFGQGQTGTPGARGALRLGFDFANGRGGVDAWIELCRDQKHHITGQLIDQRIRQVDHRLFDIRLCQGDHLLPG
ncbi:hypothetical protein D3C81_1583750 [compost metagenome]